MPADGSDDIVRRVAAARDDASRVVLEGAHALKHALRFGARVEHVFTPDAGALRRLYDEVAPDVSARVAALAVEVDAGTWQAATGRGLPSPALAIAVRPSVDLAAMLTDPAPAPVVLVERTTHLGNLGAVVRVAAAAGAAGVCAVGHADPWHPTAVRGGAGCQFALPVARLDAVPATDRPLVALDPGGTPLGTGIVPPRALLAFGTERHGLSDDVRRAADLRIGIPMRPGVSSLNLATAVAVVLYAARLGETKDRGEGTVGDVT